MGSCLCFPSPIPCQVQPSVLKERPSDAAEYNGYPDLAAKLRHVESLLYLSPTVWTPPMSLPESGAAEGTGERWSDSVGSPAGSQERASGSCAQNDLQEQVSSRAPHAPFASSSPLVIIIGGGIGGLAAAVALQVFDQIGR